MGGQSEGAADQDIYVTKLPAGSSTWTDPVCLLQNDRKTYNYYNPVLFQLPENANGDLLLFYAKCPYSPEDGKYKYGRSEIFAMRSSDGGENWGTPYSIGTMDGVCGPDKNPPILVGNRLIAPSSGSNIYGNDWFCHYDISDDYGYTWRRVNPTLRDKSAKPCQPSLFLCADGTIRSVMRTKAGGYMETCCSVDKGETWSQECATTLKNNNSGLCGLALSNGQYALAYSNNSEFYPAPSSSGPRWPLTLALSDDGENWKNVLDIEPETGDGKNQEYSYPTMIQDDNGDLLIVYTYCGKQNDYKARGNIKFVRIRL